jgi:hypothetical protein
MVNQRKKRVAMTKQLKRDVFTECLVRVSQGILPIGSFKAVADHFEIDPKTVAKLWKSTMTPQVNGYQPNLPMDPPFIVSNLPTTVFDTKFKNAGQKQYDHETVLQEIKIIDPNIRRSVRSLADALGISSSSVGSMKKEKKLRVYYTMSLKPKLNDVAYEIAHSLYEDKLIWINGPFKASVHDLTMFQAPGGLEEKIPQGKRVIPDNAYSSSAVTSTKNPLDSTKVKQLKKRARARHEIFNKGIKDFKILSDRFCSTRGSAKYGFKDQLEKHECVFKACCVLVQYDVEEECSLIKV